MGWETSARHARLPPGWDAIVRRILARDKRCTWIENNKRCPVKEGLEVDHRIPNDDHSDANLRALCKAHHARKSSREGVAARAAKHAEVSKKFRRVERHPGRLGLKGTS